MELTIVKDEGVCHTLVYEDFEFYVKWDGCVDITRTHNKGHPTEHQQHLHLCDVPQFIAMLQGCDEYQRNRL